MRLVLKEKDTIFVFKTFSNGDLTITCETPEFTKTEIIGRSRISYILRECFEKLDLIDDCTSFYLTDNFTLGKNSLEFFECEEYADPDLDYCMEASISINDSDLQSIRVLMKTLID